MKRGGNVFPTVAVQHRIALANLLDNELPAEVFRLESENQAKYTIPQIWPRILFLCALPTLPHSRCSHCGLSYVAQAFLPVWF